MLTENLPNMQFSDKTCLQITSDDEFVNKRDKLKQNGKI